MSFSLQMQDACVSSTPIHCVELKEIHLFALALGWKPGAASVADPHRHWRERPHPVTLILQAWAMRAQPDETCKELIEAMMEACQLLDLAAAKKEIAGYPESARVISHMEGLFAAREEKAALREALGECDGGELGARGEPKNKSLSL